jgi:hypothetical protein
LHSFRCLTFPEDIVGVEGVETVEGVKIVKRVQEVQVVKGVQSFLRIMALNLEPA